MKASTIRAFGLVSILGGAGVMHFVAPKFFDAVVPHWMPGSPRITTYVSGVVELASAALVANPSTRKIGAWASLATFVGVFPANIQSALNGGIADAPPPMNSAVAAWARLPFQFPLIWLAYRVAKDQD